MFQSQLKLKLVGARQLKSNKIESHFNQIGLLDYLLFPFEQKYSWDEAHNHEQGVL